MVIDTIIAISTPLGTSLKAIIRLSGPVAFRLVDKYFMAEGRTGSRKLKSRPAWSTLDGRIKIKNNILIPVTLYLMPAPASYTREDVVELHTFGAQPLLEMLLLHFVRAGARLAQPGEFTKRAFLNGRLDLTRAEAVLNLIRAGSEQEFRLASHLLTGRFASSVQAIRQALINLISRLELALDFSDQEIEIITPRATRNDLKKIISQINRLLKSARQQKIFTAGTLAVICGRPNAGKSSLFNQLVPDRQNIVTPIAGTTRDVIEGRCFFRQHLFRIRDTAGLDRSVKKQIASLACRINRLTEQTLPEANIFLFVLDGNRSLTNHDRNIFQKIIPTRTIVVRNKNDLPTKLTHRAIRRFFKNPSLKVVDISALTGTGLDRLKKMMVRLTQAPALTTRSADFLINARHEHHLDRAVRILKKTAAIPPSDIELLALDCRSALDEIGSIIGQTVSDDILNNIFSEFCVGK
ncbi:MAG: tRNA uridine-5-carboxymethylaminomethyl(34) synthesis GTPase MnmE [Planctomycetes bacterium]|nr:tRNA uridine-5-carboxymethylaminomethyl(34) synthesis GTPase MnmE [Planctomycetota bacterium]